MLRIVQVGEKMGRPGNRVGLARAGRVLDQIALPFPFGQHVCHQATCGVELVVARKDHALQLLLVIALADQIWDCACECGRTFKDTPSPLLWLNAIEPNDTLGEPDTGIVCHIVSTRKDKALPKAAAHPAWRWSQRSRMNGDDHVGWLPDDAPYPGNALLDELDVYNSRLNKIDPPNSNDASLQLFRRADALAVQNLTHTRRYIAAIFLLALLTEVVPLGSEKFEFTAYVFLLLSMYAIVRRLRPRRGKSWERLRPKNNVNEASIDLRVLAEGLRIQSAWQRAGVCDAVALRHLRHDHESLAWVRRALLGAAIVGGGRHDDMTGSDQAIEEMRQHWVAAQESWFLQRYQRRLGRGTGWSRLNGTVPALDTIGWILFSLGVAVSFIGLIMYWHPLSGAPKILKEHVTLLHGLLPAWAAMVWAFIEFAEYREDADEYRRTAQLYGQANRRIQAIRYKEKSLVNTRGIQAQRAVLHQLGIEALQENARWAHRHKHHDASITL